jgi:hypothetical protein
MNRFRGTILSGFAAAIPFAALPVVLAANQLSAVLPPDPAALVRALAIAALAALLLCLVLTPFGSSSQSAPAAVAAGLTAFGLYSALREPLAPAIGEWTRLFGWTYVLGCAGLTFVVLTSSRGLVKSWHRAFRLVGAFIALAAVLQLSIAYRGSDVVQTLDAGPNRLMVAQSSSGPGVRRPDVYHLVLDGFGRPDVLNTMYGLDLTNLVAELRMRGFEIAADVGVANYAQTYLSLASMLNGLYLDALGEKLRDVESRAAAYELIQNGTVFETFKRLGYDIHFIGSIYSATERHRLADECLCDRPLVGEFESLIIRNTPLIDTGLGGIDHAPHRNKLSRALATLESLPAPTRPRLVLAHVLSPHPPFVFDATGRPVAPDRPLTFFDGNAFPGRWPEYRRGYAEQARYIAGRLVQIVDRLEEASPSAGREAVIIVHGDHGPRARFDARDATKTDPRESIPVLLGIRWATSDTASSVRVASLVNVYRELFRRYFDPAVGLLPDRAFVSSFRLPYRFVEVDLSTLGTGRP